MSQQVDCVVAGHICLDITPQMPAGGTSVSEVFRPGKLINVGPATVFTGGTVSNTGLPLRRLGVNVHLMGKCGDDMIGRLLVDCLRREAPGAERGMQVVPGENTSYTVVINPPGIDRMFLHCPGANDTFAAADIDLSAVAKAGLFHFGYPPLLARMYADAGAELAGVFRNVRATGATTSLDMACPDPASPAGKADWSAILSATLPLVDIFTPSVEELTFMLRRRTFDHLVVAQAAGKELLGEIDGELLCELGEKCLELGAAIVLIKCGYLGLYVRTAGRGRLEHIGRAKPGKVAAWANRELLEPSYRVEHIVSTTGAGDCAIAGFLAAYLRGADLDDALRLACAVGAQNVTAADTVSGVRNWEQTVQQVAARPPRNDVTIPLPRWRYDSSAEHYVGPRDGKA
jgi:sugar/nucleoside kinase (ribokinase family)